MIEVDTVLEYERAIIKMEESIEYYAQACTDLTKGNERIGQDNIVKGNKAKREALKIIVNIH